MSVSSVSASSAESLTDLLKTASSASTPAGKSGKAHPRPQVSNPQPPQAAKTDSAKGSSQLNVVT